MGGWMDGWMGLVLSPGLKGQLCEVEHSSSLRAEVKNAWMCTSASTFVTCRVNHAFVFYMLEL